MKIGRQMTRCIYTQLWILSLVLATCLFTSACKKRTSKNASTSTSHSSALLSSSEASCPSGTWNGSACITCPENFTLNAEKTQCVSSKTETLAATCTQGTLSADGTQCVDTLTKTVDDTKLLDTKCTKGTWNGSICVDCPSNTELNDEKTECTGPAVSELKVTCPSGTWNGTICASCPPNSTLNEAATECKASTTLRSLALKNNILIGSGGTGPKAFDDPVFVDTLAREFSVTTSAIAFQFWLTHPTQNTYNFKQGDAFIDWAIKNNMKVRGTTLVWYNNLPKWVQEGTFTRDQLLTILKDQIMTVMGRYRGEIYAWNVVNEAMLNAVKEGVSGNSALRETIWSKTIGPDYIDHAFRFAREADPNAKLLYNDYNAEGMNPKSDAVYNLVKSMKERGIPIDAVGLQSHFDIAAAPPMSEIDQNMKRLAALGLEVHVTELDVRLPLPVNDSLLAQQAKVYGDYLKTCLANTNCKLFMMWGFTDKYSWIPDKFPGFGDALLFDDQYKPKPAYYALTKVFQESQAKVTCPTGFWNGNTCVSCPVHSIMNLNATACIGGTILGVFNSVTPEEVLGVKVRATRRIYGVGQLKRYFAGAETQVDVLGELKAFHEAGVRVIASVNFIHDAPIPLAGTSLYTENLQIWNQFLTKAGPYLYGVTLQNEPIYECVASDLKIATDDTKPPAITWFKKLAADAAALKKTNPKLSHLLIGTPSVGGPPMLSPTQNVVASDFIFQSFFPWAASDPNIDFIDIHVHEKNLGDVATLLDIVVKNNSAKKMLFATEWSQAPFSKTWLEQDISSTVPLPSPKPATLIKNRDYVEYAYDHPLDLQTWNKLVSTIGYDPNFMKEGFELFKAKGFTAVFYGAYRQYGSMNFDTKQLYTNLTVVPYASGKPQPNYLFPQWFKALSSSLQTP